MTVGVNIVIIWYRTTSSLVGRYGRFQRKPQSNKLQGDTPEFQRNTLEHQIKPSGGTWPITINSELIAKYSHAIPRFVKSVDFNKLQ